MIIINGIIIYCITSKLESLLESMSLNLNCHIGKLGFKLVKQLTVLLDLGPFDITDFRLHVIWCHGFFILMSIQRDGVLALRPFINMVSTSCTSAKVHLASYLHWVLYMH